MRHLLDVFWYRISDRDDGVVHADTGSGVYGVVKARVDWCLGVQSTMRFMDTEFVTMVVVTESEKPDDIVLLNST